MKQVTITRSDTAEARTLNIRPLKRKEIKALKDVGYTYIGCVPTVENAEACIDRALETVLDESALAFLDECDNAATKEVWQALLKETYGDRDAEKNSKSTTDGTPTASE